MKANFIILAAGKGSRFGNRSKVLWEICGKPVLDYIFDLTENNNTILVANDKVGQSQSALRATKVVFQSIPNGTGDAFRLGLTEIQDDFPVFVLMGDSCLIKESTISNALSKISNYDVIIGKFRYTEENNYGRVKNENGSYKVYEKVDHSEPTDFYNAGWACFNPNFLKNFPSPKQVKQELYLNEYINSTTKCLAIEVDQNESIGINSLEDFNKTYRILQNRLINTLFMNGVNFTNPESIQIMHDTTINSESTIESDVIFGRNVKIGSKVRILPFCYLENCTVEDNSIIGPFCYLRNNVQVMDNSYIGSFCEVKNSSIGSKTKVKHMSYLGDVDLGNEVNVGAGTVFCNYDGEKKYRTTVHNRVFLGGNSTYVAPLTIEKNAYVAAGSVIRYDVHANHLATARSKQKEYLKINKSKLVSIKQENDLLIFENDQDIKFFGKLNQFGDIFTHMDHDYFLYSYLDDSLIKWTMTPHQELIKLSSNGLILNDFSSHAVYIISTLCDNNAIINCLKGKNEK